MKNEVNAGDINAAPVGEREAFNEWYVDAIWGNEDFKRSVERGFQAGAAYQRQSGVVVPHDLLMRVLEPVTSEQYTNSKHELLALMREFARLNGGSHE